LGALLGVYPLSREIHPEIRFMSWLHLVASSLLLLFGFWAVLFLGVVAMPENFGPLTWAIAGGVLLLLVAFLLGLGIRVMRWLRLLKPAPEPLNALVREMSQKMGVPVRSTWVLSTHLSNAVALPMTRQLIFTDKLLSTHPDDEIKAICAHELGHLNEPRKVVFVRALVALALFPLVFINPMNSLPGVDNGFLLILIPVLILLLVGMRVSRRMEKRADKIAIESEHIKPEVYARALECIYQTNQTPAVMPRRSNKIHPDLYDRMLAAGVTPDFPKPAPAKGLSWLSYLVLAGFFVLPALAVFIKAFWGVWQIGVNP
jgi:Zn-dependent protease with chaperone function